MTLRKSACIETIFIEIPFLERFGAAKEAGFEFVEFWGWTDKDLDAVRKAAAAAGVGVCGFNGDAELSLVDPAHKKPYLDFLRRSLDAARKIGALSVTIHSNGLGDKGVVLNHYPELSHTVKLCAMYDTLRDCVPLADEFGVNLNLEPLNINTNHVGNFLAHSAMAAEICRLIDHPRLNMLFDIYHQQLNEGNLCNNLSACLDRIGHIHVADAPGRHEPGTGEINYPRVLRHLEAIGYKGIVGYEFDPLTDSATAVKAVMANQ